MPILLLVVFSLALSVGSAILVVILRRTLRGAVEPAKPPIKLVPAGVQVGEISLLRRPQCWLAVKSRNVLAVQAALGLHNAKPCSWCAGLAEEEKLFVAPPINGWVLIFGSGLPDPGEDVDACFRFVCGLSRKLGQVQYFCASRIAFHHAWVRADGGRIVRAYAWAGKTVWHQGRVTSVEEELGLKCFDYTEATETGSFSWRDVYSSNVEKVPLLAARWSLDPARVDERFLSHEQGIAGKLSRRY